MAARSSSTRDDGLNDAGRKRLALGPHVGLFPAKGERVLSIGQTGSGKTQFNAWLLQRLPDSPIIIYDTKHDPKFERMKASRLAYSLSDVDDALEDTAVDYVVIRPPPMVTASPYELDRILGYHEENWRGVDAYIDEMYHFHSGGRAGAGLSGLYTRGRSRGITTIGSTQRPAWVSGFVFSETQLFYIFRLARKSDRKKVDDFIPGFADAANPPKFSFYVHRDGGDADFQLMPPVPIAKGEDLGYTDHAQEPGAANPGESSEPKTSSVNVWI